MMRLRIDGEWFKDKQGRKVLLRGVNLSGSSKIPSKPNGATHLKTDFSNHTEASFAGRPFPLSEADQHFRRIKNWGFNCLRLLVTWEAIEHRGPGKYDVEFIDYLDEVIKTAESYKLYVIIDPHQDVWSRMSGGDGAPGWTFEKAGLDFSKFHITGAAHLMQHHFDPNNPKTYPHLSWSQNRIRFANQTMWTLFFGGKDFAPSCVVERQSIQDYFQEHFCKAYRQVAEQIRDSDNVLGFETMNEPSPGWIGLKVDGSNRDMSDIMGSAFTPFDAMVTASGYSRLVPYHEVKKFGIKETRKDLINEVRETVWIEESQDIWKNEGVWGINEDGEPLILNNDYFLLTDDKKVDFCKDYLAPFFERYSNQIRTVMPEAIIFFEVPFDILFKGDAFDLDAPLNSVHAPHWYDAFTLGKRKFMERVSYDMRKGSVVVGRGRIQKMFNHQLSDLKKATHKIGENIPTLIGEFGLPYNLDNTNAYERFKSDPQKAWKTHIKALSMYYDALDVNLLHSTQWNYTPDNNNTWGDLWNQEDFSIFSRDQQTESGDINSGGRAIKGFCRPHFLRVAGTPHTMKFNVKSGEFLFEFENDTTVSSPTILHVPNVQYPNGFILHIEDCDVEHDSDSQLVLIHAKQDGLVKVKISRNGQ